MCFSEHIPEWQQLADLTGATDDEVSFPDDPVVDLSHLWSSKNNHMADVSELVNYLKIMRRWDQMKDVRVRG